VHLYLGIQGMCKQATLCTNRSDTGFVAGTLKTKNDHE